MSSNNDSEIMDRDNINIRPWVRYWARHIDMYLLGMLIFILQKLLYPTKQIDLYIFLVGVYLVWILLEAQFLATWGTTPGKWLLKTKVRDKNNNKLSLKTALIRGLLVWFFGLGMTFFKEIAELLSFYSLKRNGITIWDKYLNCNVIHEDFGPERIPLILGALFLPALILEII